MTNMSEGNQDSKTATGQLAVYSGTVKRLICIPSNGSNNVQVTINNNDKLLLATGIDQPLGLGLYLTLLNALTSKVTVSVGTTGYINGEGFGYISNITIAA
ncbi:hypothetical protein [Pseudomonas sp. GM17]|uniref:hypothetical protein n=1 Tax=Pseudomonas sp. GM17 TaxID=1144323 RepID=UPI0012F6ED8D|nr:hypothetical protein [Pseudomonas sp. GM17]WIE48120.1 hypothetical protein PMI20_020440 [Pseudomonas sp. GM17]